MKKIFSLLAILSILIGLRFYPFFLENKTLVFGDNYSLMAPGKIFTAQWLKEGVLPLWNPHVMGGLPWIGDINQSVLYFSTWIYGIFNPAWALNLTIIFHLVIAFLGMFFLTKTWLEKINDGKSSNGLFSNFQLALIGGILYSLSTQISGSINNLSTIQSLPWLPWIIFSGLRIKDSLKFKILFGVFVLMQFLGGYPQHVIYSIFGAVVFSFFDDFIVKINKEKIQKKFFNWLFNWLIVAIITLTFSAVAWMPFVELLGNSTRLSQSEEQARVGSLNPVMAIKIVLPYFFDKSVDGMKWGPAWSQHPNVFFYLTWISLLAIIMSLKNIRKIGKKQVIFFAVITFSTLIFSLGEYLPGFEVIQNIIPLFRIGRYPSMIMILTNVVLILWAIVGLSKFKISARLYKLFFILLILGAITFSLLYFVGNTNFADLWNFLNLKLNNKLELSVFHTLERDKIIYLIIIKNILINIVLFLIALFLFKNKKINILIVVIIIDMIVNTQGLFFFAPSKIYDYKNGEDLLSKINRDEIDLQNYRFLTRNVNNPYTSYDTFWEAMVVRAPFSDSFIDNEELRTYQVLQQLKNGYTPDWNWAYGVSTIHGYTTLLPQDFANTWQESEETRINFIDRIDPSHPLLATWSTKYYLVDNWFEVKEDLSHLKLIETAENWSLYELPNTLPRFRFDNGTSPTFTKFSENPNTIEMEFENADVAALNLIVADRYDKNWKAWVNGKEVKIENYEGMRRVPILSAKHNSIKMTYQPTLFYLGAIISACSIFSTLIIYLLNKRKKNW